jgi:hypothetical protein
MGNLGQYPIKQLMFLYGINPDAVILSVNPHDEIDYIKRTIQFIENAVDCNVIALCIFPMKIKEGFAALTGAKEPINHNDKIKSTFSSTFDIPSFFLGDKDDEESLANMVIDTFSTET